MLFAIGGHRKISEVEVANGYTHRQAMLLVEHIIKDRFMVANELVAAFGGRQKQDPSQPSSPHAAPRRTRGLPSWYRARPGSRVVDLDGPMGELAPFLGKGALRRGGAKPARRRR